MVCDCVEAEYAYNTKKKVVALRLEAEYWPDGWLGPLCINNLFYDFSNPQKFNDEWSKLHEKLKELELSGCETCHERVYTISATNHIGHNHIGHTKRPYRPKRIIIPATGTSSSDIAEKPRDAVL